MAIFRSALLLFLCLLGLNIARAEDGYLDNRSNADQLVRSLYNAINNHQYARAFDYFETPPTKDFATFEQGYETTSHVDVLTGQESDEGAAGSTYFNLPVAIRAKNKDGQFTYFAGCYVIRAVSAAAQEPPYRPYLIYSADLHAINKINFAKNGLPKCGNAG
jgi:hypothetical protein